MGDAESRIEKVIFLGNDLLFTVGRLDQGLNKIATQANNLFRTVSRLYQKVLSSRAMWTPGFSLFYRFISRGMVTFNDLHLSNQQRRMK